MDDSSIGTWINTSKENFDMATWNEFVAVLDQTIGFGNKVSSSVETLSQWYDDQKDEHVTLLEYRIKVEKSPLPPLDPAVLKAGKSKKMAFLRDLIGDIERATRESER
jgi:hypothetical protein